MVEVSEQDLKKLVEYAKPDVATQISKQLTAQTRHAEVLAEQQGTVEFLLHDDSIEQDLKQVFSTFSDKENALTNISKPEQIDKIMLEFDDAVCKMRLYSPHYKQTAEHEFLISKYRHKLYIKILRSTGGKDRERAMIATSIFRDEKEAPTLQRGGIMGRVGRWFKK